MEELAALCPNVREMEEAGHRYVSIPELIIGGKVLGGLLCLTDRDGYPTRLFLTEPVLGKGQNWSAHQILGRTWHTCSWNQVSSTLRPAQVLAEHMRGLR
jgi:hypothetical protein